MNNRQNDQFEKDTESMSGNAKLDEQQDNENLDTSIIDEHWAELTQDWQDQPVTHTDVKALLKQTKRRTIKAKLLFGSNIIATLGIMYSWLYGWLWGNWEKPLVNYLGFGTFISIIFCYLEFKIRQKAWANINDAPDMAINNAIEGYRSSLNYIKLSKWSFLPLMIIINYYVIEVAVEAEVPPAKGLIIVNIFMLVLYVITHIFGVKRQKELDSLLDKTKN